MKHSNSQTFKQLKHSNISKMKFKHWFFLFLFSLSGKILFAQEVQKLQNGTFVIVQSDGRYEEYDAKNVTHKKAMKLYKEEEKKLKKEAKEAEKMASVKEKKAEPKVAAAKSLDKKKIAAYLKTLEEEKDKIKLAEKATNDRILKEEAYDEMRAITSNKENKDLQKRAKSLVEAKKVERKAAKELASVNKKATKARETLAKFNINYSAFSITQNTQNSAVVEKTKPAEKTKISLNEKPKEPDNEKVIAKKESKSKPEKNIKKASETPKNVVVVKDAVPEKPVKKIKKLAAENDVMITPPTPPCNIAFDGVDEFSGKRRKETETKALFQFTEEAVKKYYEGEDFMICDAYLSSLESGFKYLTFIFTLSSDNVGATYGWLEKDNQLTIRFLDGKTLTLYNTRTDRGTVDNVNRKTTYKAICTIGSGEEKMLEKGEADALRVMWSTGTEDYEIYDVDFFANLLKCINKK